MTRPLSGFLLGFLSLVLLGTTAIISSCSMDFGGDNVGDVNAPANVAPQNRPQVPESMKTGTVTGETGLPPQGIY
jgi:hypothetical protein